MEAVAGQHPLGEGREARGLVGVAAARPEPGEVLQVEDRRLPRPARRSDPSVGPRPVGCGSPGGWFQRTVIFSRGSDMGAPALRPRGYPRRSRHARPIPAPSAVRTAAGNRLRAIPLVEATQPHGDKIYCWQSNCAQYKWTPTGSSMSRLKPPPASPNCVSSRADPADRILHPAAAGTTLETIQRVIESMPRTRVRAVEDGYLHAVFTSALSASRTTSSSRSMATSCTSGPPTASATATWAPRKRVEAIRRALG